MVHKKYIKRGDKTYGPYYYESYREDGRVKKKYVGVGEKGYPSRFNTAFTLQVALVIIAILIVGSLGYYSLTGKSILEDGSENVEQPSSGQPAEQDSSNTEGVVSTDSASSSDNSESTENVEQPDSQTDNVVSGTEEENSNSENSQPTQNSENGSTNNTEETNSEENQTSTENTETSNETESEEENSEENQTNYTGEVELNVSIPLPIPDLNDTNVSVPVQNTTYNNETEIILNNTTVPSVPTTANETNQTVYNETQIDLVNISLLKEIPTLRIPKNGSLEIDLSEYFMGAESYNADISNISVSFDNSLMTLTPNAEFSGAAKGKIIGVGLNNIVESNEFNILVSSGAITIQTSREKILIGEPVKWIKNITLAEVQNISIDLPAEAQDIVIKQIGEEANSEPMQTLLTGNVISYNSNQESWLLNLIDKIMNLLHLNVLTGFVVNGEENTSQPITITLDENATQYTIEYTTPGPISTEIETSRGKEISVFADEKLNYTNAIASTTFSDSFGVKQSSNMKLLWHNYDLDAVAAAEAKDLELYNSLLEESKRASEIPEQEVVEEVVIDENSSISVINTEQQLENTSTTVAYTPSVQIDENGNKFIVQEVTFDTYDLSGDGNIDYVEWVVPHFSEQFYEIILITKAEHLDGNRTFIADVYDEVKELDGTFVSIPNGNYVRVVFEQNLTNEKDITIYANSTGNTSISVYEKDSNIEIATFTNITGFEKRQILLQNLTSEKQDTFDLFVSGENVEFDYIVDPVEIDPTLETGLLVLYHLNNDTAYGENGTFVYDFGRFGINGTVKNVTANQSGKIGGAYEWVHDGAPFEQTLISFGAIDSTNRRVLNLTGRNWTFAAWVKFGAGIGAFSAGGIVGIGDNTGKSVGIQFSAAATDNGFSAVFANSSGGTGASTTCLTVDPVQGTWYHALSTYNGSYLSIYVDGVLCNSLLITGIDYDMSGDDLGIGHVRGAGTPSNFNGTIDEVAIWNRSLSTAEISTLYQMGQDTFSLSSCGDLAITNGIYNVTQHLTSTGTCLNVLANNITIRGNGYTLNYSSDPSSGISYGINVTNRINTTIKDFVDIRQVNTTTIGGQGEQSAIYITGSTYTLIQNSSIQTHTNLSHGIFLTTNSNNNIVRNVSVYTMGANASGIHINDSKNNLISNSTFYSNSSAADTGSIMLSNSNNNTFTGLNVSSTRHAFAFGASEYNSNNLTVTNSITSAGTNLYIPEGYTIGGTGNFTNVSRTDGLQFNTSWGANSNATINVHWYLDAITYVNQTGDYLQNANVTITDVNGNLQTSQITGSRGNISRITVKEYTRTNNGGASPTTTYFSMYSANVTKLGYADYSNFSINMTTNRVLNLSINQNMIGISYISPTPANGTIQSANSIYVNVSSNSTYDSYVLTDFERSLIGWWRMGSLNSSGGVVDISRISNNGTVGGNAAQNVSGKFGKSFSFDGNADEINIGDKSNYESLQTMTVSAWVKTPESDTSVVRHIVSKEGVSINDSFGLYWEASENIAFTVFNSTVSADGVYLDGLLNEPNIWKHVVGVYNGTNVMVYVNGVLGSNIGTFSGLTADSIASLKIGRRSGESGSDASWNGSIDEVIIFNRSLTQAEILSLYNSSANQYQRNFTSLTPRSELYNFRSYAVDIAGNVNSTETRYISIPANTVLDAYSWAERAGWFAQSQGVTAVVNRTYFFANYTIPTGSTLGPSAVCNVSFVGGIEDDSDKDMTFNSTAVLYYYNRTFQYAGNYSWNVSCAVDNYVPQGFKSTINVSIPIRNVSSLGYTTGLGTVNHNEYVNLTLQIPNYGINNVTSGYNLSSVWANITRPDNSVTTVFLSGSPMGGIWNGTYVVSEFLGNYTIRYYANLTNRYDIAENISSAFVVKNTSISIFASSPVNTTDVISVSGLIRLINGTGAENLANNLFVISLNNVIVSSDTYSDTNFTAGNATNVNVTSTVQLNLSGNSGIMSYIDDFTTQKYQTDSISYNSIGYASGEIFSLDAMTSSIGNVTYRFTSPTQFYNASVRAVTKTGLFDGGANTSIYYSYDNSAWTILNSSVLQGANITGSVPVNGRSTFYIMLTSNTSNFNIQNPIVFYNVNYTQYQYVSSGNFVSKAIQLPNITYTVLKWDQNTSYGNIALQLRESDDGITWSSWSSNYTNSLVSSITGFTKQYIQYNATLNSNNLNYTPILNRVNISYFNASTNSTGGYNYNITIPTDSLGTLPLKVSVVQSPEGIVGFNTTNIVVWARTSTPYIVVRNYTQPNSNYSVHVNFTRTDTGELINGTINVSLRHSSGSVSTRQCYGSQCIASWFIPQNISYGNYTINITAYNETAFYFNASANYTDFLEERNTTGNLFAINKTISDLTAGVDYLFYWNITINNTANASMLNAIVYNATKPTAIRNFSFVQGCTRVFPGTTCNVTALIAVAGGAQGGTLNQIPFRVNWSDNDGGVAGGAGFISYTEMYLNITLNASIGISNSSANITIQHARNGTFNFTVSSTGTDTLVGISLDFVENNLTSPKTINSSWINITPSSIASLTAGSSRGVNVTITIPTQTDPGNYSGIINITSNGGERNVNVTVEIPVNGSWYLVPQTNFSYNRSFSLDTQGEVGNFTLVNIGNINITMNISYSPTSGAGADYSLYGTNLFAPNFVVGSVISNPTGINVTKGGNATIMLWHKGYADNPLTDVGVTIKFFNESGDPTNKFVKETFNIAEQPPVAVYTWFSFDNFVTNTSIGEQNRNITIKSYATDDINLHPNATYFNITWSTGSTLINASIIEGETSYNGVKIIATNYSASFMPTTTGLYQVTTRIFDAAGNSVTSGAFNFTVVGSTTVELSQNYSSTSISNVDLTHQGVARVNYTLNNTGQVYAYDPTLTFAVNSTINISTYYFANISALSKLSTVIVMNISPLTPAGQYNVTATLTWRNPNNIYSTDEETFSINVLQNKSILLSPTTVTYSNLEHGYSNSTILTINNTGNMPLSSMSFNCYTGSLCANFTLGYNESSFGVARNATRFVNISISAPVGLAPASYNGFVNLSEQNISTTFEVQVTVPTSATWNVSSRFTSANVQAASSGRISGLYINNTGNTALSFLLASSNATLIVPNSSSITVVAQGRGYFDVNYTAPTTEATYSEIILINESTLTASPTRINVSVNLSVTQLFTTIISPTSSSPLTDVEAGDTIVINANLSYINQSITNSTTWTVLIGGSSCSGLSYEYLSASGFWNMTCAAPSVADGRTYNLTLSATHTTYGTDEATEDTAVSYRDISPPIFSITRNNVTLGSNISLRANVTDNVQIDRMSVLITYPNSSQSSYVLTNSTSDIYLLNNFTLNLAGEYIVNYSANDTTGNINSTIDWFEVNDNYYWSNKIFDSDNAAVNAVNITFFRPNTTLILLSNSTNSNGFFNFSVNRRNYDLQTGISNDKIVVKNANFSNVTNSNITLNIHQYNGELLAETIPLFKPFMGLVNNATGFGSNVVEAVFNYTGYSYDVASQLKIVQCNSWDYSDKSCSGSWSALPSSVNLNTKLVTGNGTGFTTSAFFLAESKCGNGACEAIYSETSGTCNSDCQSSTSSSSSSSGGGGGGGGGLSQNDLNKIAEIIRSSINLNGVRIDTTSIYREVFSGDTSTVTIRLTNTLGTPTTMVLATDGEVSNFLSYQENNIALDSAESRDVLVRIAIPKFTQPGDYVGNIIITSGDKSGKIPVTIKVLAPEGKLLDVKIQPLQSRIAPGETLRLQLDLLNLGQTKKVDIQFELQLMDAETGQIITRQEEAFAVETSTSTIKNLTIPESTPLGHYLVKGTAYYASIEANDQTATSIAEIDVSYPFWKKRLLFVPLWIWLLVFGAIGIGIGTFYYLQYLENKQKRFKSKVEFNKLPQPGANTAFVGKIAETGIRAFTDLNKLQMHTFVAGSTGGGKTVAAQAIVEAALMHNKSVIVFDPTAQWTGFFRKCEDKTMLNRYKFFDMNTGEARAFNGVIKTIHDPYEFIDIKKYIERPGEITVFNVSNLTPAQIDTLVASTIEQIFNSHPEESSELKTLIVYDEVHRLLPKFGGTGQGFIQIERGAREFRKWGIGLVLISQVLSDFVGEIKANIGTEIQLGTRYEGDLERVNVKYGEDVLKSVVKEPIGTGMVVNAEYNSGRPYFVAFRPLLHSTKRLSKLDLEKYEKYYDQIEDIEYQIEELKKLGADVFDVILELKLAREKVKEGQFQIADMYLESLLPNLESSWNKLGKKAVHLEKTKLSKKELVDSLSKAAAEREKYIKENPEEKNTFEESLSEIGKIIKDKKGKKDTTKIEVKFNDFSARVKSYKGKLTDKDKADIQKEMDGIKKEAQEL